MRTGWRCRVDRFRSVGRGSFGDVFLVLAVVLFVLVALGVTVLGMSAVGMLGAGLALVSLAMVLG